MTVFDVIQNALRQAELRDAVAQDAADLVLALKDRHLIAVPRQDNGNGQSRRAGADDSHPHPIRGSRPLYHLCGIGGGNIIFNGGKMDRRSLPSQNAVSLALVLVIADQAAHGSQGIVVEKQLPGLVQLVLL